MRIFGLAGYMAAAAAAAFASLVKPVPVKGSMNGDIRRATREYRRNMQRVNYRRDGRIYPTNGERECERRRHQIDLGYLTRSNGLVLTHQ